MPISSIQCSTLTNWAMDGLLGLYDQPRYLVLSRQPPDGKRGRELQDTVLSSQFTTPLFLKLLEIPDTPEWPPTERALSQRP
eukprot:4406587-Pleurochrysis_carterae.AAC.1